MYVCLSHETALEFWRRWSVVHAMALASFHGRTANQARDLPYRTLPASSKLKRSVTTRSELDAAVGLLPDTPDARLVREIVEGTLRERESAEEPGGGLPQIHVLGVRHPGTNSRGVVRYHHSSAIYPKGSFYRISAEVWVCLPEIVFCQMAEHLGYGALVALGFELCGCYPAKGKGSLVRHPLSSAARIGAVANALSGLAGLKMARTASRAIKPKSASVAETELSVIISAPRHRGGFAQSDIRLNEPVLLDGRAARIARTDRLVCDIVAPPAIAFEYDSSAYHEGAAQLARDARRKEALAAQGYEVHTVTADQFSRVFECQELIVQAFASAGIRLRRFEGEALERHLALRADMRRFHWRP